MNENFNNLYKNLSEIFGDKNITIKAFENGKPIIDIENGINKLNEAIKEKESLVKPVFNPANERETAEPKGDSFVPVEDQKYDEFGPGECFTEITSAISKDDFDETYLVHNSVCGKRITDETKITFDYLAEDDIVTPGVTDADLIWILLYRNRSNSKLFGILKEALQEINENNLNK